MTEKKQNKTKSCLHTYQHKSEGWPFDARLKTIPPALLYTNDFYWIS